MIVIDESTKPDFQKHPLATNAPYLRQMIQPLADAYGINHFCYQRLYAGQKVVFLTTTPGFAEDFDAHRFYKLSLTGHPDEYAEGYYLPDYVTCPVPVKELMRVHGFDHWLFRVVKQKEYVEFFCFGAPTAQKGMINIYLNYRLIFETFCDFFKVHARHLIIEAEADPIIYRPECVELVLHERDALTEMSQSLLGRFSNHFRSQLTTKELECASYLAQCLSMKEIARRMNISVRTIEKHVFSLKTKLKAKHLGALMLICKDQLGFR